VGQLFISNPQRRVSDASVLNVITELVGSSYSFNFIMEQFDHLFDRKRLGISSGTDHLTSAQ
jgi:hypothetical protein